MRMQDAVAAVRAFASEGELLALAIELGAPVDQFLNGGRPFFHQRMDGRAVAQAVARVERVLLVQCHFIVVAERYRDAALRIFGRRLAQRILGDDQHAAALASSIAARKPATPAPITRKSQSIATAILTTGLHHTLIRKPRHYFLQW